METITNKPSGRGIVTLLEDYRLELNIFFGVFVLIISTLKIYNNIPSAMSVEQWMNLTFSMFHGEQDFLFSYGPLYWITGASTTTYSSHEYWLIVIFWAAIYAAFWSLVLSTCIRSKSGAFLALVFILFIGTIYYASALFLISFCAVMFLEASRHSRIEIRTPIYVALGVIVGFALYIRFFHGLTAFITLGAYFFSLFLVNKKIGRPIAFIAATAIAYIVVGAIIFHEARSLIDYLIINRHLSFGNSIDMTMDVDTNTRVYMLAGISVLLINISLIKNNLMLVLPANAILLICFKTGFSRIDHYIPYFIVPAAVISLSMVLKKGWLGKVLFLGSIGCLYVAAAVPAYTGAPVIDVAKKGTNTDADYETRLAGIYQAYKLPETVISLIGNSKVDVYPYINEYAYANKLNYYHRPLFQNFMTLTPELDKLNQEFFESSRRPEFVIWTPGVLCSQQDCNFFDNFDNKYSLNEDPLTTSAILNNYKPVMTVTGKGGIPVVIMKANSDITKYKQATVASQRMEFGKWYKVPTSSSGIVKVIPNFEITAVGKLQNTLFRGQIVKISYMTRYGVLKEYRLNIINSKSGIMASALPSNFEMGADEVDSIKFSVDSSHYMKPSFNAEWIATPFPALKPIRPQFDNQVETPQGEEVITCDGSIDSIAGVIPAPATSEVSGSLKLNGWLVASKTEGKVYDKVFITLLGKDGSRMTTEARKQKRPDLAQTFVNPAFTDGGYESFIDLSGLKGTYSLTISGQIGKSVKQCDWGNKIIIQ